MVNQLKDEQQRNLGVDELMVKENRATQLPLPQQYQHVSVPRAARAVDDESDNDDGNGNNDNATVPVYRYRELSEVDRFESNAPISSGSLRGLLIRLGCKCQTTSTAASLGTGEDSPNIIVPIDASLDLTTLVVHQPARIQRHPSQ